jgi:hypothetical protein
MAVAASSIDPLGAAAERLLDDEELVAPILEQVRMFPRVERDVLALCAWRGLSQVEAAAEWCPPRGAARAASLGESEVALYNLRVAVGGTGPLASMPCMSPSAFMNH